jgi:xeroderma pigmentosum group C-complementing protein
MRLTEWWYSTFEVEETGHIKNRTFRQAEEDANDETFSEQFEVLRTSKSLMKHALMRRGSRDCSSILFASLCRALLIPSRLVVSLQPVPWQANVGRPKEKPVDIKGKGKAKAVSEDESEPAMNVDEDDDDDDMEEVGIPTPSDDATPVSSPQMSVSSSFEDSPKPSPSKKSTSLRRQVIKTRRRKNVLSECKVTCRF